MLPACLNHAYKKTVQNLSKSYKVFFTIIVVTPLDLLNCLCYNVVKVIATKYACTLNGFLVIMQTVCRDYGIKKEFFREANL